MTARVHRALTAMLASLTGIAALLSETDPATLGVDAIAWNWVVILLAVGTIAVTAFRQGFES